MLSKDHLVALDAELDRFIPLNLLDGISRESALLHLIRFQAYWMSCGEWSKPRADKCIEVVNLLTAWIWKSCQSSENTPDFFSEPSVIENIKRLFLFGLEFEEVFGVMNLLFNGWRSVSFDGDQSYRLSFQSSKSAAREYADLILGVPEPDLSAVNATVYAEFSDRLKPRMENERLTYNADFEFFQFVRERVVKPLQRSLELRPSWTFGEFNLHQFREVWLQLLTLSLLHTTAVSQVDPPRFPVCSAVPARSKKQWVTLISKWSGLSVRIVEAVLEDLTLDSNLVLGLGAKKSDVLYQPFVNLGGDLLALNTSFVLISNWERNFWDLMLVKRPKSLRNLGPKPKEDYWLENLIPKFQSLGLCAKRIRVPKGEGDIDLMVFDSRDKFALGIQMKFEMSATYIKKHLVERIIKGQQQAENGVNWIKSHCRESAKMLLMSESELNDYEIRPLVLTKSDLLIAYIAESPPVLNDSLLFWIICEPLKQTLRKAWEIALEQSYLPVRGKHFEEEIRTLSFGGKVFERPMLRQLEEWDPVRDIRVPSQF